ncbi:unnamed protein product [Staurois parvus]|uniref:Uncharacterized protein n=1 Tax=Staurois parvus TaxID=386267 RepID=A0ABN9EI27_9NEOB|nr:unnamed protein product [Staurois parvus]
MQGPGRPDIVNAGSGDRTYSECRVRGERILMNAGSGESGYSECSVRESGYSECRVRGERI